VSATYDRKKLLIFNEVTGYYLTFSYALYTKEKVEKEKRQS
jgi:hypothetical protein